MSMGGVVVEDKCREERDVSSFSKLVEFGLLTVIEMSRQQLNQLF